MKIPKNAKRVFRGKIFEVYHWKQKMFDGSYKTFERLKRPDSANTIAVRGNKIVLCELQQPGGPSFYSLFGGRLDRGEEPIEAAKRELLEESGLASDDWELFKVYEPSEKIDWSFYFFIARGCKTPSKPKSDEGEKIETFGVSFDEFLRIVFSEKFRNKDFANELFRMRFENKLENFKKRLFKK